MKNRINYYSSFISFFSVIVIKYNIREQKLKQKVQPGRKNLIHSTTTFLTVLYLLKRNTQLCNEKDNLNLYIKKALNLYKVNFPIWSSYTIPILVPLLRALGSTNHFIFVKLDIQKKKILDTKSSMQWDFFYYAVNHIVVFECNAFTTLQVNELSGSNTTNFHSNL